MKVVQLGEDDVDNLIRLGRMQAEESSPHLEFDDFVARHYADQALNNFEFPYRVYMAYSDEGDAVGYLIAYIKPYIFSRAVCVGQEMVFVVPEFRGTKAFIMLMKVLDALGKENNAVEIFGGVENDRKQESLLKWFKRNKYEKVGYYVRKII